MANCSNDNHGKGAKSVLTDTAAAKVKYPDTPDLEAHIRPLFSYIEQHKQLPEFDTDISFEDQGFGPIDNYGNFVEAGHLFSAAQTHMLVFYDIGLRDHVPLVRMILYKRNEAGTWWYKVLDDTILYYEYRIRYKDWNNDGIKDLSYVENGWDHGGHGPITWYLWLMDKEGVPHKVKGFEELDDPRIDSVTHHIFSNMERHTQMEMAEYIFSGDSVRKVSDDMVVDYDDMNIVQHYRNGKLVRKVKLKVGESVYTPMYREMLTD